MDADCSCMCFIHAIIPIIGRVAPCIVVPIQREVGYFISYEGNFTSLIRPVKRLKDTREAVNHSVEDARRRGQIIEDGVLDWLEEVIEVIERADEHLEDPCHRDVGCSGWIFPNLISRYRLGKKTTKIANDVAEVQGRGVFVRIGYRPAIDASASSSSTGGGEMLKTRELVKESILKALRDPKPYNIGVYGLGGVGKTTLVNEVVQIAKHRKLFDTVVIAHVSKNPDIKEIQGVIADMLGLRFEEETIAGRAYRLRARIEAEKTILVILDDIWQKLELEKVGIPSTKEHNGCKLLMTSRSQNVLLNLDVQKDFTFILELLSEAESWSLFQSMAGDVVNDISFEVVATQISQICKGLPLLIVTAAGGLKSKDIHVWEDALRQLQSVGHAEMDDIINSALELRYNWLESDEIKALFLLSAVLRYESADYLLKVAMGLGIFSNTITVNNARNRVHTIIESLKASCLLIEGNNTNWNIQMHDLVRDVAISIAHRDKHVYMLKMNVEWNDYQKICSQIILSKCLIHELPQSLDCPNVKFFFLDSANRSLEIPDTIFDGMGSLKVLDLTRLNLSSLPTSFRSLTGLQTLCLDQCILENMDIIEDPKSLKILSLGRSSMNKLPSKIREMTQLRMLDLSHSGIEVIPPKIISSLTKLEELYMGDTSIKWEDENSAEQKENASLAELRQLDNLTVLELQIHEICMLPRDLKRMFEKLQRYKIVIGDGWEWPAIKDGTLKTLMLKLGTDIHLEHGIKALIKGVEKLYLDEVEGIENVCYQMNGEGFPLLKHLNIQNNKQMKHIVDSMERNHVNASFLNLETLLINNLENLEQIYHGPPVINSFGKLSVIKVKNCDRLKYLLSLSMVKGLVNLSEIEVCGCKFMKNILLGDCKLSVGEKIQFPSLCSLTLQHLGTLDNFLSYEMTYSKTEKKHQESQFCVSTPFFIAEVAFPNLETLKLSSLNLNKIWDNYQHSMDNLTVLIVENCGGLKYLFSSTMVGSVANLKRLEISKCNLMNEIIATRKDATKALKEVSFPKLESIMLKDMENLKTVWHSQFDTLKTLQVQNCEKIVAVFPSSMQKTYNNLEKLVVKDCALVEEIFELTSIENSSTEVTAPMEVIILDGLPKLKNIWSMDPQGILSFHNLQDIELNKCGNMEYLFPLSVAISCPDLKQLCIHFCGKMKQIVSEERPSTCTSPIFEFKQLTIIHLCHLHSLKGFYAGNHTLACPSLRTIDVLNCAKLNLYKTGTLPTGSLKRCEDANLPDSFLQPLFIIEEVVPNLKKLIIDQMDAKMLLQAQNLGSLFPNLTFLGLFDYLNEDATFPYWFLQNAPALKHLDVARSSFKKIFEDEIPVSMKLNTRLKMLRLDRLSKLQHICEEHSQIHSVLECLEHLAIFDCPSLTNVLPSSVTFSYLIYLDIKTCSRLVNLITSRTARSLVNLTVMKVRDCDSLQEIITVKENVDITFVSLEILILQCLPSLNKFCSSKCFLKFPLLKKVIVSQCPRMKIFSEGNTSTPNLRKVRIEENGEDWIWKGSLNDTIKEMFGDKSAALVEHTVGNG